MRVEALEAGSELDRVGGRGEPARWWVYLHVDDARPQAPRLGVPDRGFHFARGGRAATLQEAQERIAEARRAVADEYRLWRGQPSHLLGPAGQLIPVEPPTPELSP